MIKKIVFTLGKGCPNGNIIIGGGGSILLGGRSQLNLTTNESATFVKLGLEGNNTEIYLLVAFVKQNMTT